MATPTLDRGNGRPPAPDDDPHIDEIATQRGDDRLHRLRVFSYRYRESLDPTGQVRYGLRASEVAAVAPELVLYDHAGRPIAVRYHELLPLLLAEVQRLRGMVVELTDLLARHARPPAP